MKIRSALTGLSGALILGASSALFAQDTPDDVAVWAVIEQQWEDNEADDDKWIESLLVEDFTGWNKGSPAPRTRDSVRLWQKFENKQWDGKVHELFPLSIVVHGDTAIAHYLYSNGGKTAEGKLEVVHGRYTDVLIRTADGWKFITWAGGPDSDD